MEQGATILGLGSIETSEGNKRLGDLPAGETGGNREGKGREGEERKGEMKRRRGVRCGM